MQQKTKLKEHLFACSNKIHNFWCRFYFSLQLTPFSLQKLCLLKHYTNSVFSRAQLLWITNSKQPLEDLSKSTFLPKEVNLGLCPVPAEAPMFVVLSAFLQKTWEKDDFAKTDSVEENALSFSPSKQESCFAIFLTKPFLEKSTCSHPPKNYSSGHFLRVSIFLFFFCVCLFST